MNHEIESSFTCCIEVVNGVHDQSSTIPIGENVRIIHMDFIMHSFQ